MSKNCEECLQVFKLALLTNQKSQTPKLFIYYHEWQGYQFPSIVQSLQLYFVTNVFTNTMDTIY